MRMLLIAVIAVCLVGVGIAATLGVQAITDDGESAECQLMNMAVHDALYPPGKPTDVPEYFKYVNDVLDARFKTCHP